MSKRCHSDVKTEENPSSADAAPYPVKRRKRHRALDLSDQLAPILEQCEDLLESISALGSSQSHVADEVKQKLGLDGVKRKTRAALELLSANLLSDGPPIDETAKRISEVNIEAVEETRQAEAQKAPQDASLQIPSFTSLTKWEQSDSVETPPLLQVLDPALESIALCHTGEVAGRPGLGYERLEWLGDAYVHIVSSVLLYQTFPNHDPGQLTMLRELLLRNATLGNFTEHFGLDKRAKLPLEFADEGRPGGTKASGSKRRKILGDIFEAYAAAAMLADPQNGVSRLSTWLKALWRPIIGDHLRRENAKARKLEAEQRQPGSVGDGADGTVDDYKTRLRNAIGARGVNIRYEDIPSKKRRDKDNPKLFVFTVGVFLDGWGEHNKLLGQGTALSKSKAGQLAAEMALDNKKQIAVYSGKKEALRAAAAAQGATGPGIDHATT